MGDTMGAVQPKCEDGRNRAEFRGKDHVQGLFGNQVRIGELEFRES